MREKTTSFSIIGPGGLTRLYLGIFFGLVGLDQVVKLWALQRDGVIINRGVLLGWLPSDWWWVILAGLWTILWRYWKQQKGAKKWWLLLVLAGGWSNIFDRLAYAGVVDMIYYPKLAVYGNIADIYLGIGVLAISGLNILSRYGGVEHGQPDRDSV